MRLSSGRAVACGLNDISPLCPVLAWTKLVGDDLQIDGGGPRPPLIADRCDFLDCSAGVDPLAFVKDNIKATLTSGDALFGQRDLQHFRAGLIRRDNRSEYARLVVRQLRVRKVVFCK